MSHPLDGCRAKLDRAKDHLDALRQEIDAWEQDDERAPRLEIENESSADNADRLIRVRLPQPIPPRLGLLLGDAMHNTRTALDHLVCRVVELNHKTPGRRNAFPIYEHRPTEERNKKTFAAALNGLRKDHKDQIRKLQPFERRGTDEGRRLVVLGALDNADKHRIVVPTT